MAIRDQPQYKKMETELKAFRSLKWIRPFLYLFGPKGWKAAKEIKRIMKEQLGPIQEQFESLRNLPDRFNDTFRKVGWIATDDLNVEVMGKAIQIYSEEGLEPAEVCIEQYYNESLDFHLRRFLSLPRVQPRRRLLELALEDHKAGRFHASVPVVLAQVDGIAHDLVQKSFYERGKKRTKHLQANETAVGDPTGLPALAELLSESRSETRDIPISLPYRHGILHGRDLGYATCRISTKALAILVALRPWILAVDRGEQFKQPEKYFDPDTATWDETKAQWKEVWEALQEYSRKNKEK